MSPPSENLYARRHATTILSVRKGGQVVMAGDGQVSRGARHRQANAKKVRRLGNGQIAGRLRRSTADAFTLFERPGGKLERPSRQLLRACIEACQDCAPIATCAGSRPYGGGRKDVSLLLSGSGDVLEPRRRHRHRLGRQLMRWLRRAP